MNVWLAFFFFVQYFHFIQKVHFVGWKKNRNGWMNVPGWRSGPHTWQNQGSGGPSQDREIRKNRFNPLEKPNSSCAHSLLMSMGNAGALVLCKSYGLKNFSVSFICYYLFIDFDACFYKSGSCASTTPRVHDFMFRFWGEISRGKRRKNHFFLKIRRGPFQGRAF